MSSCQPWGTARPGRTHPAASAAPLQGGALFYPLLGGVMQLTLLGGPPLPCAVPVCDRGQECGLPARKRPRWPRSQAAGGRAARGGGRRTGPGRLTPRSASHVLGEELFYPLLGGVARRAGVGSFLHHTLASGESLTQPVNNHFHRCIAPAVVGLRWKRKPEVIGVHMRDMFVVSRRVLIDGF